MPRILQEIYDRLFDALGPQHWWPADAAFEMMVSAMLVQNTSWKNVKRAMENLRQAEVLEPHALMALPEEELQELIGPVGYFRVKAKRLRSLVEFLVRRYGGSVPAMFRTEPAVLRKELLAVYGVGRETADSILLYAGAVPRFVVDAYTHRIFARHGWIAFDADYDQIQEYLESGLPADAALYNEYHALLVRVGKDYCHKTAPKCPSCPLRELLPAGGPLKED